MVQPLSISQDTITHRDQHEPHNNTSYTIQTGNNKQSAIMSCNAVGLKRPSRIPRIRPPITPIPIRAQSQCHTAITTLRFWRLTLVSFFSPFPILGTFSCHNSGDSCNALNVCEAQMIASIIQHRACMLKYTSTRTEYINQSSNKISCSSCHTIVRLVLDIQILDHLGSY